MEDESLRRARAILSESASPTRDMLAEYASLADSYASLLRKLHKTLVISDSYQSQLLELNGTLSQRIEEETERRLSQERMLARNTKLAAMGEMIDAIAHQWRQPLSALSLLLQNLCEARRQGKLDDAYMERTTGSALSQIRYMTETIGTFRSFFRLDKKRENFSVSAKVAEAASLCLSRLTEKAIGMELTTMPGTDTLNGFPNEFVQVIVNLLANGCDAIMEKRRTEPCGNVNSHNNGKIIVTVIPEGKRVIVEVCDNGIGIPPEDSGRLFEPDFSTKTGRDGTGLGLYMSRLLVEQSMGGGISFTSAHGKTVFRLELPRDGVA